MGGEAGDKQLRNHQRTKQVQGRLSSCGMTLHNTYDITCPCFSFQDSLFYLSFITQQEKNDSKQFKRQQYSSCVQCWRLNLNVSPNMELHHSWPPRSFAIFLGRISENSEEIISRGGLGLMESHANTTMESTYSSFHRFSSISAVHEAETVVGQWC